jgi:tetratricopeptide (TPR) repeat protein
MKIMTGSMRIRCIETDLKRSIETRCGFRRFPRQALTVLITVLLIAGCGDKERNARYDAEKTLFGARKMRGDLFQGPIEEAFLQRALDSYRGIVADYSGRMYEVEGLAEIVVSAQMELAELEFNTGMFEVARSDFERALDLARDIPPAKANALYSCAVISEEMKEPERAAAYYERLAEEFLGMSQLATTARMNTRYLVAPLKLFALYHSMNENAQASAWLGRAEEMYRSMIESERDEAILKEIRFNLLTAYLQGAKWNRSLEYIRELEETYRGERDAPALLFLEAKVKKDGVGDIAGARELFRKIYDTYGKSQEAPRALLAAADIHFSEGAYDQAEQLYKRVVDEYPASAAEVVQAEWQRAQVLEQRGRWGDASLKYKSIYQYYPGTEQGLQAPLMIIKNYRSKKQWDAAKAAYEQAIEHYERLISSQAPAAVKILAESHLVTAHADMERWEEAISLLLRLPDEYPRHPRFRENYLIAASIYERELGDPAKAAETLRICMERYPGTPLAAEAEKQYRRLKEAK